MRLLSVCVLGFILLLSGCGGSKKKEVLAGFYEGCYFSKVELLKAWCKCAVDDLDKKMSEGFFEKSDDFVIMQVFKIESKKPMDKCRSKVVE